MKPLHVLQILLTLKETSGPYNQHSLAVSDTHHIAVCTYFKPRLNVSQTVAGFAREIQRYKQMSTALRTEIGEKCRKLVEARFSLAAMQSRYEEVYSQVIGAN